MWEKIQKLGDRLESRWALYLLVGGSGAVTTWLAVITDWLNAWGPIAWGGAFFGGVLAASVIAWLVTHAYVRWQIGQATRTAALDTGTNPLETEFDRKTVRLPDFYSPEYVPHRKKRFRHSKIVGPGNALLAGYTSMDYCDFRHCQFVIIEPQQPIFGVVVFEDCIFDDCLMANITFLMPPDMYDKLDENMKKNIRVINAVGHP